MNKQWWFIVDDLSVLGYDRRDNETLLERPISGAPIGALHFHTEVDAQRELDVMKGIGTWPLFSPAARVLCLLSTPRGRPRS